jgi:hypothetical protein
VNSALRLWLRSAQAYDAIRVITWSKADANNQCIFGIVIGMYWDEHNPPHFHARYGEFEAIVGIESLGILQGSLPRRVKALVLEWAEEHRDELMADWSLCRQQQHPKPIQPLE